VRKPALSHVASGVEGAVEWACPERSRMGGNLSAGKRDKVFVRLKLGLIGFVLNNVRGSLFVVLWHKPLVLA